MSNENGKSRKYSANPKTTAATFRLQETVNDALETFSKLQKRPKNKIVNEAVAMYLATEGAQMEEDIHVVMESVARYKSSDPNFDRAIAKFVEGEVLEGHDDPTEGEAYVAGKGNVSEGVRRLLHT